MRAFAVLLLVVIATLSGAARADDKPSYAQMLAQLKSGDTSVDFQALRYAYSETPEYAPYGGRGDKRGMFTALNMGDYDKAAMLAKDILTMNYTDIDAHYALFSAYDKNHDGTDADFERAVVRGLIDSIRSSGDGKTPDTAYVVIAVPEEYSFLGISGYKVDQQALVMGKDGPVDAMTVTDQATKQKTTIYFNVSRLMAAFGRQLGGKAGAAP